MGHDFAPAYECEMERLGLPKGVQAAVLDGLARNGNSSALANAIQIIPILLTAASIPGYLEAVFASRAEPYDENKVFEDLDITEMTC